MRKEGALSFKERFFDHSMLGWIKKQRKRRNSKSALWKKAATLQEKVEEMCRDYCGSRLGLMGIGASGGLL